jgi:hypothetical protein
VDSLFSMCISVCPHTVDNVEKPLTLINIHFHATVDEYFIFWARTALQKVYKSCTPSYFLLNALKVTEHKNMFCYVYIPIKRRDLIGEY